MKINSFFNRYVATLAITAIVLLSGFSFAITWNSSNFIDSTFWVQNPTSGDVKTALFGIGTNTGTVYTNHWVNNTCVPANITVEYVAAGDRNTAPTITANTIYVLTGDQTLSAPIDVNVSCVAIVASGTIVIDHSATLTPTNSFFTATSVNSGLIIDGIESLGAQIPSVADNFLYTTEHDNVTINHITVQGFGTSNANGVLHFDSNSDNIGVFNSYIHDNLRTGIRIYETNNVHIIGNDITRNIFGIFIDDSLETSIRENKIYSNSSDGIYMVVAINTNIQKNEIFNNTRGIFINNGSTNTSISNTKIYNNSSIGLETRNTTNTVISNTTIHNNGADGIYTAGSMTTGLVIDTVQSYNNNGSAVTLDSTNGTILHNIIASSIVNYSIQVVGGTNNKYYGNIQTYGGIANVPTLVAGSASDTAVANLGRESGVMTTINMTQIFPLNSLLFCELGAFHNNMWMDMSLCADYGISSSWTPSIIFADNGEPYFFGEKVLKQTNIPYYSGTVLRLSNNTFNPQLYITDNSFGGWIQTTGGSNYTTGLIHYTNTNQLRIYASQASEYSIGGMDLFANPIENNFNPAIITGNILAGQSFGITLPWTGDNGYKVITGQFSTGGEETNIYRLFRRYDTTGPDQITLNTPAQNALVVGNQTTLNWSAGVDTGAGISGYNYIVATNSGFTNILFSGTTGALTEDFSDIGFYPDYYRQVQGFDNLGNLGTATTGVFHYGFGYFAIVPVNTIFPTNSGQTFTITAYDTNNSIITGYTNTVTFSLTGTNTTPQTPPTNYTFTLADTGVHTFTGLLNINYPGIYTFDVMDTLSGTRMGSTTVTVTGQAPSMFSGTAIFNPSTATSGIVNVSLSATSYPANYQILVDNLPRTNGTITTTTNVPVDLSTLPANGNYTITIILNNGGYYTYTITTPMTLDTINPILTIQSPATGSYQTLNQPPLNRSATETGAGMSGYTVVMSGTSLVYTAYNHSNSTYRSGTPLTDGPRTMTVYGYDNAGNYGTAATSFMIDNTAPIIVSGYPNQVVITNPFAFTWNVVDTGGISGSSFMLKDFYGNPITPNWTTIYATSVTPLQLSLGSSLIPGIYRWKVKVTDNVSLTTDSPEFIFGVHNAIPGEIQGFMELQSNFGNIINYGGNIYSSTTQIQAALFSNITTNVAINGAIVNPVIGVPLLLPFPYTMQAINLTPGDGIKNFTALFTAGSLNPYSVAKQVILDTTAPTVPTLTTPINGVAVTGTITLSRSGASDAGAGISGYVTQIATNTTFTTLVASGTTTNETINIASGVLTTGQYYRRIVTTDRVGNQSISEVESFTIAVPNTTVIINGTGAIPNTFSIPAINNANPNISYRSSPVTVAGLNNSQQAAINVSAGTLIKNGTNIGTTGTAVNGDILEIDLIASSNYNTQVNSTLTVGTRSAVFNLKTKTEDQSYNGMTNTQRLQIRIIFDSMVSTYGMNDARTLTLMTTLRTAIESMLSLTNYTQSQKDALEYFLTLVNGYINDKGGSNPFNGASYTARNGRVFSITFDTTRAAYTSPQFIKQAYFSSWTSMKLHIDVHNPGSGQGFLNGTVNNIENANRGNNIQVMPNGKIYRIDQTNGRRYSPDTISQKQFNSQSELLAWLRANNQVIGYY